MTESTTQICVAFITTIPALAAMWVGLLNRKGIGQAKERTEEIHDLVNGNLTLQIKKVADQNAVIVKLVDPNQTPTPSEIARALEPVNSIPDRPLDRPKGT